MIAAAAQGIHTRFVAHHAMTLTRSFPPGMVFLLGLLSFTASMPRGLSQNFQPVSEYPAGGAALPSVDVMGDEEGREGLDAGISIGSEYNDNIYYRSTDKEEDLIFRASPFISLTAGDAKEGRGGFVRTEYRPAGLLYTDHSSDTRVDHDARIWTGWRGAVTSISADGVFQKQGDATAEVFAPTDRTNLAGELRVAWHGREKLRVETAAGIKRTDYDAPRFFDYDRRYGEIALKYEHSPKTELGIAYRAGTLAVDGSARQDTQAVLGSIVWKPRGKILVSLEGGAERRDSAVGSRTTPVLEARAEWRPREKTKIYLKGYMREEASVFYRGQNFLVRGGTAGVSQRLGEKWEVKLEGGMESNSYRSIGSGNSFDREDKTYFLRPAVSRRFSDQTELSFFYRISSNNSTTDALTYDQSILGVELKHEF